MSYQFGRALALALFVVSCAPEEDVPFAPVSIRIDARDPFGARPDGPVNVTLLWTTTGTIYASSNAVLQPGENTVELPLDFIEPRPPGLFFAEFTLTRDRITVHVPRVALYRDDDGSGDFTAWNLDEEPVDRIVAVNGAGATSVAAVRNFETALTGLTAVDVNTFYSLTDGLHTPFLRFAGATSTLTPDVLAASGPPIVSLYFDDSEIPARDVRCVSTAPFQTEPELPSISATGTSSRTVAVQVDETLDVEVVCGLSTPNCRGVDIETVTTTTPADLRTAGRRVLSQCRRSASFESLVTLNAELRCEECSCGWVERHDALVVRTASTPPGWPCGQTIAYCPSPLPLFRVDEACFLAP